MDQEFLAYGTLEYEIAMAISQPIPIKVWDQMHENNPYLLAQPRVFVNGSTRLVIPQFALDFFGGSTIAPTEISEEVASAIYLKFRYEQIDFSVDVFMIENIDNDATKAIAIIVAEGNISIQYTETVDQATLALVILVLEEHVTALY